MERINFYEKKCQALEIFYCWVDQGSEYDIAVEQSLYYNSRLPEIDKIILNITIGTRYARCGKVISEQFCSSLKSVIPKAKALDFKQCGFSEEEIKIFKEEIQEAESLISSFSKNDLYPTNL